MKVVEVLKALKPEDVAAFWPYLAYIGFGPEQVREVIAFREAHGLPCDMLQQGLDRADAAVEIGAEWVMAAILGTLALRGEFGRPPGYLSPEERAARDERIKQDNLALLARENEQIKFQLWRDGLRKSEVEAIKALGVANLKTAHVGEGSPLLELILLDEWRRRGKPMPEGLGR